MSSSLLLLRDFCGLAARRTWESSGMVDSGYSDKTADREDGLLKIRCAKEIKAIYFKQSELRSPRSGV
jgi:hypothetical protein